MISCYSPNPGTYAVIRMDPVAMVQHLDDPDATAAASAMHTQNYLAYIECDLGVPFPHQPWYRYRVCLIGPSARARDAARGITPGMCVPIYPNPYHPARRAPLRTDPEFPFDNCYHWFHASLDVRVRSRSSALGDENHAIHLPAGEQAAMHRHWRHDLEQVRQNRMRNQRLRSVLLANVVKRQVRVASTPLPSVSELDEEDLEEAEGTVTDVSSVALGLPSGDDSSSSGLSCEGSTAGRNTQTSGSDGGSGDDDDNATVVGADPPKKIDLLAGLEQDTTLLPLVDLWQDLPAHLEQDGIPDPCELFKERDAIVKIIQESRRKAREGPLELRASIFSSESSGSSPSVNSVDQPPRRKCSLLMNILNQARSEVRRFVVCVRLRRKLWHLEQQGCSRVLDQHPR